MSEQHAHHHSSGTSHHHYDYHNYDESNKNKKKKKKAVIFTIISVILLLCLLVFFGINYVLNKINYKDDVMTVDPNINETIELPTGYEHKDEEVSSNIAAGTTYTADDATNILLIGYDLENGSTYYPRSDSMIIVSINNSDQTVRLASLSRAVYVSIPGHSNGRLNAAYAYGGPSLLMETIELNYKIKLDNYVAVNFDAFKSIVDIFGGVDIKLTQAEVSALSNASGGSFANNGAGVYHLDGESALIYSRIRSIDNDRARTQRQRNVLLKIAAKVKSMSTDQAISTINQVLPLVETNLTKTQILSHAAKLPKYISWNMQQTTIPDKSSGLTLVNGVEVLFVDWAETRAYANSFLYPKIFVPADSTTKANQ